MNKKTAIVCEVVAAIFLFVTLSPTFSVAQAPQGKAAPEKKADKAKGEKKESQEALAKEAKITMRQAKAIALKKAPGTVKEGELEREKGKLIYSFDIVTGKEITEVQVSAIDGSIVAVEKEDMKKEAKEKAAEAKKK